MKKLIVYLSLFSLALAITIGGCKRGESILVVGYPDESDFPVFDTFDFPTSKYYFYGRFDGAYKMWQDSMRSAWDTITRIANPDPNGTPPFFDYEENLYYNFTNIKEIDKCGPDSTDSYIEVISYFIRPGDPFRRLEIYFYKCVDLTDTNNPYWPNNYLSAFQMGANPFTNPEDKEDGVRVLWVDENLSSWETAAGSGQLQDTYFRIKDLTPRLPQLAQGIDTLDTFGLYELRGEFAGRLFNGNFEKAILDAEFNIRVVPVEPF